MIPSESDAAEFELRNVSVQFSRVPVIKALSLRIRTGEKIVLRGPSGSGKSTLLRLLLGFVRPDAGEVRFRNSAITSETAWSLRKQVAYVSQQPDPGSGTAAEFLAELARIHGHTNRDEKVVHRMLQRLALSPAVLAKSLADLSGGERQRILLVSALLSERPVLLLDEPTSALDGALKERTRDLILETCHSRTLIAAAHDDVWYRKSGVRIVDFQSP
jgi:putative ABC transport system ATP-binding protein